MKRSTPPHITPSGNPDILLEIRKLCLSFPQYDADDQLFTQRVVHDFSLQINKGEIVAVVGASGAGKSLLVDAVLGILPHTAQMKGEIVYKGTICSALRMERLRGREMMLIPQSVSALDPLMKVGKQIQTVLRGKRDKNRLVDEVLVKLALDPAVKFCYPYELSGGMARRVLLATAMLSEAELLLADEPTPGLDDELNVQTLKDLRELADQKGKGILLISHDLKAVLQIADRIAVIKAGRLLEVTTPDQFSGKGAALQHPYTRALWKALPENEFING